MLLKKLVPFGAIVTAILGFFIILFGLGTGGYDLRLAVEGGLKVVGGAILMGLGVLSLAIYLKTFKDEKPGVKE